MATIADSASGGLIYRAVWRWHFYAGLIVLPFLLWLAVTGSLYLYKPEIERLVYADWSTVAPASEALPLDRMISAIEHQSGARVVQVIRPAAAASSWRMMLSGDDGTRRLAFVDPYRGRLLGTVAKGGIMQMVRDLHSLAITGPIGNALIEIVAGWAALLVLTGLYLWWPRRGSPVVGMRGSVAGRVFWRDFHASIGFIAAAVILFLAVTGMPWTGVAGKQLQGWVAGQGYGRPVAPGPNPWEAAKSHDHGAYHDAKQTLPWSMQEAKIPIGRGLGDIGPGKVAAIATMYGLSAPWTMTLPRDPQSPYLVSRTTTRAEDAHILYVEAASGRILQDARFCGFGVGARAIEWGIATHQGQEYGEVNRLMMLAGCLSIVLLAFTAPVLWWKRRVGGRLEAPPRAFGRGTTLKVAAAMAAAGLFFPLTGLTILVAFAIDSVVVRLRGTAPAS